MICLFSNSKLKRNVFYGNIINWSKASWDATYMTKYDSSYSEVCKESKSEIIFFVAKQKLDLNSGTTVCNAIKGSLNVIIDQENQKSVIEAMNEALGSILFILGLILNIYLVDVNFGQYIKTKLQF